MVTTMQTVSEPTAPVDMARVFIMDTTAGKAAKRSVLSRARGMQATSGSYRCTACGKRCEVSVEYDDAGNIVHSKGQCKTPGCIAWEE
jgi:hypothetical protein